MPRQSCIRDQAISDYLPIHMSRLLIHVKFTTWRSLLSEPNGLDNHHFWDFADKFFKRGVKGKLARPCICGKNDKMQKANLENVFLYFQTTKRELRNWGWDKLWLPDTIWSDWRRIFMVWSLVIDNQFIFSFVKFRLCRSGMSFLGGHIFQPSINVYDMAPWAVL